MKVKEQPVAQPIVELTKSREIERVKQEIYAQYGFWASDRYIVDLINFVGIVTQELTE